MKLKIFTVILLGLLLPLPWLTACAKQTPTSPPAEPKGEIVIGILEDFSKQAPGTTIPYKEGVLDGIRYINENKGGIGGNTLQATVIDHRFESALVLSGWDRIKSEGAPAIISVYPLPITESAAQKDHIVVYSGAASINQLFPQEPSYFFGTAPVLVSLYDSLANQIEKDWARRNKTGIPKVGFDFLSFGTWPTIFEKKVGIEMNKRGWAYMVTRTPLLPAEVTTQVLQLKNFEADYLYIHSGESTVIAWLKDLNRQNFHPTIFGTSNMGADEVWQATGELCKGTRPYQFGVQWTERKIPLVELLHELNAKWYPDVRLRPSQYIRGFTQLVVLAEALERTVKNVGYENMSGEAVKDALETIRDFEPMGLGTTYTWSPTDHQGLHSIRWYEWTSEGVQVSISDWDILPDLPQEQRTEAWWLQD